MHKGGRDFTKYIAGSSVCTSRTPNIEVFVESSARESLILTYGSLRLAHHDFSEEFYYDFVVTYSFVNSTIQWFRTLLINIWYLFCLLLIIIIYKISSLRYTILIEST